MRDFFRSGKRKVGIVTLVLVCVLAAGWVRSLTILDRIELPADDQHFNLLLLYDGKVEIESYAFKNTTEWTAAQMKQLKEAYRMITRYTWTPLRSQSVQSSSRTPFLSGWDSNIAKRSKLFTNTACERTIRSAPYWWFVSPLTLISTWLLLSKPRTCPSVPISEV